MVQNIGVFTRHEELIPRLQQSCDAYAFVRGAEADAARIIIVDSDSHGILADGTPRKSVVRIVLHEERPAAERKQGEVHCERSAFLANPAAALDTASDLVQAVLHAAHLEQEVGYLKQIHDLMELVEAEEVSERITRSILGILGLQRGTLLLHDPRLERYVISFSNDEEYEETGEFLPGVPAGLLQRALAAPECLAIEKRPGGRGLVVMPLRSGDDLLGVVRVPLRDGEDVDLAAIPQVSRYVSAVGRVVGNIYQLTRSRDLAMRDDLTKAFNRRFFESYLDEEMERARRYGSLFSIIFLDLDDLKKVNNVYGHLTGSRTLQEVAKRILNAVRGIDKVVRFGGDEFCIILPQTDPEQAIAVANRVRKAFVSSEIHLEPDIRFSITASFGIATYPTHAMSKEDLIRQADAAMYRVKSTTKNAVGVATEEGVTRPAVL
jgi:diguanylate cyclase (GGDEF)-like protein